jgi:hypothetical protein
LDERQTVDREEETMKYMLMFCETVDRKKEWEALPEDRRNQNAMIGRLQRRQAGHDP